RQFQIPVIQARLGDQVAGATLDVGGRRVIVVGVGGRNEDPFVLRSTLAHELGHLLYDPQQELRCLRVDEYEQFDRRPDEITDPVWEARERYTTVYHPIRSLADHPARAGRFSAVVLRAAQIELISWDTAGEWLLCDGEEVRQAASAIQSLYPDLF